MIQLKIRKPNYISIIYLFLSLKILSLDVTSRNFVDFIIWGLSVIVFFLYFNTILNGESKKIFISFVILILLQVFGLIQICTFFSITSIIATFCIMCFILTVSEVNEEVQSEYIIFAFLITILWIAYKTYQGKNFGNTLAGCVVFFFCTFLLELSKHHKKRKYFSLFTIYHFCALTILIAVIYICLSTDARTALFTIPIMGVTYLFLSKTKTNLKKFFLILIVGIFLITVLYINIHTFSWYEKVNMWSINTFGKQLDSSRPSLWKASINELEWWQFFVGAGTGKLPSIIRYETASFHNSYIQLLMQNGILGLGCLLMIFYCIWNRLILYTNDRIIKLVLSFFVGILIYNCFECTLLQNKAFMGLIEWFILCVGLVRIKQIRKIRLK